jgi:hypothetical protein
MQLRDPEPLKDRQAVHTSSSQGYAGQGPRPAFERASCVHTIVKEQGFRVEYRPSR